MSELKESKKRDVKARKFSIVPEKSQLQAWDLYSRAFEATQLLTPRPQPLSREKFFEILEDPDFLKIFLDGGDRQPKAMIILTKMMGKIDFWINIPFLRNHYPKEFENHKIQYVVGILTAPEVRGQPIQYFRKILEIIAAIVEKQGDILLQDFSPESAPDYSKIVQKYFGDQYKYLHLDRQVHGSFDVEKDISDSPNVQSFDILPIELNDRVCEVYFKEYEDVNVEAVQPQSLTEKDFRMTLQDPDYKKFVLRDEHGEINGFALVAKKVSKTFGWLNEPFVIEKYGAEKDFFILIALTGSLGIKSEIIQKICYEAQKEERDIYFIGSERAMSDTIEVLTEKTGIKFNYDGSQNYGIFSLADND